MLERAIEHACKAHKGQKRFNGEPYILHPIRVMLKMKDEASQIVAIMHDVFEDSSLVINDFAYEFPEQVIEALKLLTHGEETYESYLDKIKNNALALKVKLADIRDNFYRLDKIANEKIRNRLYEKYSKALKMLGVTK